MTEVPNEEQFDLATELVRVSEENKQLRAERDDFETLAMVNAMNMSDYTAAMEQAKIASEERDGLAAVIAKAKARIGSTRFGGAGHGGPTHYFVNSVYEILEEHPAATITARDAKKQAEALEALAGDIEETGYRHVTPSGLRERACEIREESQHG
jgi:hypothetical protein